MLNKKLASLWDSGKFAPSWIIATANPESTLAGLTHFAEKIMGLPSLPIANNPDFRVIRREPNSSGENLAKHITVDQIRELQKFFSTTNATSPYKIAVIYEADAMNINASNCCLKLLEDTPKDSFIFLITSAPGNILVTIRSRCAIIHASTQAEAIDRNSYLSTLEILGDDKVFMTKLGGKIDKDMLSEFGRGVLHLLGRLVKKQDLTQEEEVCARRLGGEPTRRLLYKFEIVKRIMDEASRFDLDPRASFVLMIEAARG